MAEYKSWSDDKLLRKIDQESEMAGLAFQDNDRKDAVKRLALAERYWEELRSRR